MQSYPPHTLDVGNIPDEIGNMSLAIYVNAIVGQFLSNNLKFLHALRNQLPDLCQYLLLWSAYMLARDNGYGTVSAMTVAALTDFQVSIMLWRCKMSLARARHCLGLAQVCEKLLVVELTIELVHLGNFFLQLILIAL